jgi:hypothetical protein
MSPVLFPGGVAPLAKALNRNTVTNAMAEALLVDSQL